MKKIVEGEILQNKAITPSVYAMVIYAPDFFCEGSEAFCAGQFIMLYTGQGEHLLPRPISVCKIREKAHTLTLVYQIVGQGTAYFASLTAGVSLRLSGPLGNGFTPVDAGVHILVGGGVGVPPLLFLAESLKEQGAGRVVAALGFREEPFLSDEFVSCCDEVVIATENGQHGVKGNAVTLAEPFLSQNAAVYACGPRGMLRALCQCCVAADVPIQISTEERMACGIGSCVGCAVALTHGNEVIYKRACKDGPVFDGRQVVL